MASAPAIVWFTVTAVVGLLMWAARVSPTQAESNLSAWLRTFGIQNPPQWLRDRIIDRRVRRGALVALLALMFIGGIGADRLMMGDVPIAIPASPTEVLSPAQDKLLRIIFKYQRQFAASKLIIGRDGSLIFDEQRERGKGINLVRDLYGSQNAENIRDFDELAENMPEMYVRYYPEMRFDSPFVVGLTDYALRYLSARP